MARCDSCLLAWAQDCVRTSGGEVRAVTVLSAIMSLVRLAAQATAAGTSVKEEPRTTNFCSLQSPTN